MDEDAALRRLFDVFGAVCSLDEIGSAYLRADGDLNEACEILFRSQEASAPWNGFSSGNDGGRSDTRSLRSVKDKIVLGNGCYASSSYSEPKGSSKLPGIEVNKCAVEENVPSKGQETVDFLFSVLGESFKLQKEAIKDVLRSCGYDAKKTMEHFLATASAKRDNNREFSPDAQNELEAGGSHISVEVKISISTQNTPVLDRNTHQSSTNRKSKKLGSSKNEKSALQKELLQSLFCAPRIPEEAPKKIRLPMGLNRTRAYGQRPVVAPLDDDDSPPSVELPKVSTNEEDEDDPYMVHRKAAKQYWEMMRAYYKEAVEAFTEGDKNRTAYLREQGDLYLKMAQEADEKSAGLALRVQKRDEEFVLNLNEHRPKEAVKLLKSHLQHLAGIPTYQYMKVLLGADDGDARNEKRRKLVRQFLEKEFIEWTEDAGAFLVEVRAIDPEKLSFVKNSQKYEDQEEF